MSPPNQSGLPSNRKFGVGVGSVLLAITAYRLFAHGAPGWIGTGFGLVGLCLFVLGLLAPHVLGPANAAWMKLGLLIGKVTNPVVMALIFYLIVTPYAVVMRVFGRDELRLKPTKDAATHWEMRKATQVRGDTMKNQF